VVKIIYLDNAATTPVRNEVLDVVMPYFKEKYANASSVYKTGRESRTAVENARGTIAACFGAKKEEIFFTSSGTESDNWAIKGAAAAKKGKHIITTAVEHHAVLNTCKNLEKYGYAVTYIPVDKYGRVNTEELKNAIRNDTVLISVMMANNEIGTIEPIKEIGKIAKERRILFHTDAVQAAGHLKIDVNELNIDLMSFSGHKFGAQKGVGGLFIRKGTNIDRFMFGGAQEMNMRAGTENVPGIVGMAKALELSCEEMERESKRLSALRDRMTEALIDKIPHSYLNGHRTERLPGNCNISFDFTDSESVLQMLDMKGICASGGPACSSGSHSPSHVLMATGVEKRLARGAVRFTLGYENTEKDVEKVIEELPPIIEKLRKLSPEYNKFLNKKA